MTPSDSTPKGCPCQPGHCMATGIFDMGQQMPCRDLEKAAQLSEEEKEVKRRVARDLIRAGVADQMRRRKSI
jgi:hypothetical protein